MEHRCSFKENEADRFSSMVPEELYSRFLDGERYEHSTRGPSDRRSPPFESNGQSRRMRQRRNNPTSQEPVPSYLVEAIPQANGNRSYIPAQADLGVTMPPMQQGQSSGAGGAEVDRSASTTRLSIPTGGEGSHPLSPSAPTFWPQGWAAPGEANIVANPLRSASTSSGESGEER